MGEWHEEYGITIATLDNPGWSLKVDLASTQLENRDFQTVDRHTSEEDWLVARRAGQVFEAFGGPSNLGQMMDTFLSWARETTAT